MSTHPLTVSGPFDLAKFRAGEAAVTRGGHLAKFARTNDSQWPLTAKIARETGVIEQCFNADGTWLASMPSHRDLIGMLEKSK